MWKVEKYLLCLTFHLPGQTQTELLLSLVLWCHSIHYLLLLSCHFVSEGTYPRTHVEVFRWLPSKGGHIRQCTAALHNSPYLLTSQNHHAHKRIVLVSQENRWNLSTGQYFHTFSPFHCV